MNTWIFWRILLLSIFFMGSCSDDSYNGNTGDNTGDAAGEGDTSKDHGSDRDDNNDNGDQVPDWATCAADDLEVGLLPLDMLLAIDTSYSMDFAPEGELLTKWEAVKGAIKRFVNDNEFEGAQVGLQFFPLRQICSVETYSDPAVPFGPLPQSAQALSGALDAQRMAEGTPMAPLLAGALTYAGQWAADHPDRRTVVVLATDGIPDNTCLTGDPQVVNTLENVETLAADAFMASPPVATFVIGVGSELTALNRISVAGNGEEAILVDLAGGNVEGALLEALEQIRLRSICEHQIADVANGKEVDPKKVNVLFTDETVTKEPLVNVNVAQSCELAPTQGWYYNDQEDPTAIVLCPQTCARVQSKLGNKVQIVLGCPTIDLI